MSSRILDTTLLLTKTAYSGYISASINNTLVHRHVTFETQFKTCLPVDQVFLSVKVLRCLRFLSSPFLLELIPVMNSCTFFQTKRPLLLSLINKIYENRETAQSGLCGLVSVMGALFLERDVAVELSTVLFCQVTHQLNTNRD